MSIHNIFKKKAICKRTNCNYYYKYGKCSLPECHYKNREEKSERIQKTEKKTCKLLKYLLK